MFSCEYCEIFKSTYFNNRSYYKAVTKPFQSDQNTKIFFIGQPWWPKICFIVPQPLHFEIHLAGPENTSRFQSRSFKHNSVHMLSLNLTHTFSFEPRFCMFIVNGQDRNIRLLVVFARKAKHFAFAGFVHLLLLHDFPECRGIWCKECFYRPSNSQ